MTVYVDLLFGLNAVINYLLLRGSAVVGGCPVRSGRLLLGAVLGGVYAVVVVLPGLEWLQRPLFQLLCAAGMLLTAFGWKRNTVKQGLFFLALSFAFSGMVLLLIQSVEPACLFLGGRAYYAVTTPALLLLAGLGYGTAALVLRGCGTHTGGDIIPVTLLCEGRDLPLKALRDTGNTLRDPMTGHPVLIVEAEQLLTLLGAQVDPVCRTDPTTMLEELAWQCPKHRFSLVPYRAVGVDSGLLPALRCRLRTGKQTQPVLAAFSPTAVSADGRYDALWGGELL